ncbi:SHOCT domain-containing protein [Microbacterium rhizosphaerae]|uniref:SHOCT domain-containing protein n=1 Tax=Microbacterium rhizosphaerae TaxID=1678237 RepID=A0ABZ0SLZ1_9MICO|nr:SHOCT domain-containing protein [Microbacterium rhizosphaerae]WPR88282.1 SHOCT domain-containing protein [Microbacterium rhizosphaerae]
MSKEHLMYGWMMTGTDPVWWVVWIVTALLIIAAAVAIAGLLTRSGGARPTVGAEAAPPARDILDQRYARGEIDHDEYIRRRDELAHSGR